MQRYIWGIAWRCRDTSEVLHEDAAIPLRYRVKMQRYLWGTSFDIVKAETHCFPRFIAESMTGICSPYPRKSCLYSWQTMTHYAFSASCAVCSSVICNSTQRKASAYRAGECEELPSMFFFWACTCSGRQQSYSSLRDFMSASIKNLLQIIRFNEWNSQQLLMVGHRTVSVIKIEVFNINFCSLPLILLFSFFDNSQKNI